MQYDTWRTAAPEDEYVDEGNECPACGESRYDWLVWDNLDYLNCETCGVRYDPSGRDGVA